MLKVNRDYTTMGDEKKAKRYLVARVRDSVIGRSDYVQDVALVGVASDLFLRQNFHLNYTRSDSSEASTGSFYDRRSIASSAFRSPSAYVLVSAKVMPQRSIAPQATNKEALAKLITARAQGFRGGLAPQRFNSNDATMTALSLIDSLDLFGTFPSCFAHFYDRIFRNVLRVLVAQSAIAAGAGGGAIWAARPVGPTDYYFGGRALNSYQDHASSITAGTHLQVELSGNESERVMPYLHFLLGCTHVQLDFDMGAHMGNDRRLHLNSRAVPALTYSTILMDRVDGVAPVNWNQPMMFGLAAGAFAGAVPFGNWDWNLGKEALRILSRSMPSRDCLYSGVESAVADLFAEPHLGATIPCGSAARATGYNYLLHNGSYGLPYGPTTACILTVLHSHSVHTGEAMQAMSNAIEVLTDWYSVSQLSRVMAYTMQLALRQIGMNASCLFPRLNYGAKHGPNVPGLPPRASELNAYQIYCGNEDVESFAIINVQWEVIAADYCGAKLSQWALSVRPGTHTAVMGFPYAGNCEIGRCFSSIHPATINSDMFVFENMRGRPGVPMELDVIMNKQRLAIVDGHVTLVSTGGGTIDDRQRMTMRESIGLLGHAVALARDSIQANADWYIGKLTPLVASDDGKIIANQYRTVSKHLAQFQDTYCLSTVQALGVPPPNMRGVCRVNALYSDYCPSRCVNLTLLMPQSERSLAFLNNDEMRARFPAYVMMATRHSVATQQFSGAMQVVAPRPTKKLRTL